MKLKSMIRGMSACFFVGACAMAQATPTTYNVLLSNATDTLTGTITTNGSTGQLIATDFLGFSFTDKITATAQTIFSFSGTSVSCNSLGDGAGCGFSVSRTGKSLYFDNFVGDGNQTQFTSTMNGGSNFYVRNFFDGSWLFQQQSPFLYQFESFKQSGQLLVASVPEPETYAMLLSGLCIMGLIARRRRKS